VAAEVVPDLGVPRRVHVVNVGGAGMSAIATVLAQMGHEVSGTDANDTPFLEPLRRIGVDVEIGDHHRGVAEADVVVTSTATPDGHADVVAARGAGVPVVHRGDALEAICRQREVVAVAGTHGKSTTSAMLATTLAGAGDGAGYLVGTRVTGLGANADWRRGPRFVVEADESDATFLRVAARHGIVTNVEPDHLSFWGSADALFDGFRRFVRSLDGFAVLCLDDPGSAGLVDAARRPVTYGTDPLADHHVADVGPAGIGVAYTHTVNRGAGQGSARVTVPSAPGLHNARNAAAAIAAAVELGVDLGAAAAAIGTFAGVARRFEVRGEAAGVTFVDSYDHLPTEVVAALAAARSGPFERVVCVFQPHRYTRTRDLAATFADAFTDADVLGVTELYPAGEAPIAGVTGRAVLDAVLAAHPEADASFLPDLDAAAEWLVDVLRPGDCCITLNAGDLTRVPDVVLDRLRRAGGS
jgi:UDP-N-acetylmuramate--alanine ligase